MARTYTNLLLFDYDGVVAVNPKSFDIMKEALIQTVRSCGRDCTGVNWTKLFSDTSGTTERNLSAVICSQLGINDGDTFLNKFITERANLIQDYSKHFHNSSRFTMHGENVYPDFQNLMDKLVRNGLSRDTLIGLVTGNPERVMRVRLPTRLQNTFRFFVTGELADTRKKLIEIAKTKAIARGWQEELDIYGRSTNAFYFDDTVRAILDGVDANVRCVHIPRILPENSKLEWEALDERIIKKYGPVVGRRLICGNEVSSPSIFVPFFEVGLNSPFIMRNREIQQGLVSSEGFIDPRAHQMWSTYGERNFFGDILSDMSATLPLQSRR